MDDLRRRFPRTVEGLSGLPDPAVGRRAGIDAYDDGPPGLRRNSERTLAPVLRKIHVPGGYVIDRRYEKRYENENAARDRLTHL